MKPAPLTVLVLLLLAAPAQAAPTLAPLKPCYVAAKSNGIWSTETISVTGGGFTPGGEVTLQIDGNSAGRVQAAADGAIVTALSAPTQNSGQREFTVTAVDGAVGSATVSALVTRLDVEVTPRRASPSQTVTFTGRGFTMPSGPMYAHYVLRGKVRKTLKLGKPSGPCGTFTAKRRQFPMKRPSIGKWLVRIDQDKSFREVAVKPYVDLEVDVRPRPIRSPR
jgi:hypothetical protein